MNRKATPDILGALMGGAVKQESLESVKQASKEEIKQENKKAIKQAEMLPTQAQLEHGAQVVAQKKRGPFNPKEKATFNLSVPVLNYLDDLWMEIRKIRRDKKISKTDIVEQAIHDAIEDFKLKGESSKFYSRLESNKAGKP